MLTDASKHSYSNSKNKLNKNITIFHQNIQYLANKIDSLQIILEDLNPNIVALCEHGMKDYETSRLKFENYSISSFYCRKNSSGGGVMILSKVGIKFKITSLNSIRDLCNEKDFECCVTEFSFNNISFVLVVIYRTPNYSNLTIFFQKFDALLDVLVNKFNNIVVCGDININVLVNTSTTTKLKNILTAHNVRFLVDFPTRVTNTTSSAIDNFITNLDSGNCTVSGVITALSDHDGQIFEILANNYFNSKHSNYKILKRNFSEANIKLFNAALSKETWYDVFLAPVEKKYDVFLSVFLYYFNVHFPKKYFIQKTEKRTWITDEIKRLKNELIDLSKKTKTTTNLTLKSLFKEKKKKYKQKVSLTKKHYYDNKINNSTNVSKSTWSIINSEVRESCKIPQKNVLLDTFYHHDLQSVCEKLNLHYTNVVNNFINPCLRQNKSLNSIPRHEQRESTANRFKFKETSFDEMIKIISNFESKYSSGYDDIPMVVIKAVKYNIAYPLVHLVNSSFISGIFPNQLKVAKIKPLYKNGNPAEFVNYRPISLLSAFSKIYEKIVYNQLLNYLEINFLFDKEQHGFRPGRSVITAAVEFVQNIIEGLDKGKKVTGVFMDLSKAFDSVSHDLLLGSLNNLGIKSKSLAWFQSYLQNRKQYVEIINNMQNHSKPIASPMLSVKYGVPQGSVLGPLLFLCYMKGLPGLVSDGGGKLYLYADDANLIVTSNDQESLEIASSSVLSIANQFFIGKNLLINPIKSSFIQFCTKQTRFQISPHIQIDGKELSQVNSTKFLGLIIDKHLSWNDHVNHVVKKIGSGTYALFRMSKLCNLESLKMIYFSMIQSHIIFGICIYGSTSKSNLDRILIWQKKAIRIMLGLSWRETVKQEFVNLQILSVYSLYIYQTILFVKNQFLPQNQIEFNNVHPYYTRHQFDLIVERHNLELFKKKTTYMGNKFLKLLPTKIKEEADSNKFKKQLKEFLIHKPLYSIEEFYE